MIYKMYMYKHKSIRNKGNLKNVLALIALPHGRNTTKLCKY